MRKNKSTRICEVLAGLVITTNDEGRRERRSKKNPCLLELLKGSVGAGSSWARGSARLERFRQRSKHVLVG